MFLRPAVPPPYVGGYVRHASVATDVTGCVKTQNDFRKSLMNFWKSLEMVSCNAIFWSFHTACHVGGYHALRNRTFQTHCQESPNALGRQRPAADGRRIAVVCRIKSTGIRLLITTSALD